MRRVLYALGALLAVLLIVGVIGVLTEGDKPSHPTTTAATRTAATKAKPKPVSGPGSPAVYARIAALKDCAALQAEFDKAMNNAEARPPGDRLRDISLAYADAANKRITSLGC
jgi:hypothetical protein